MNNNSEKLWTIKGDPITSDNVIENYHHLIQSNDKILLTPQELAKELGIKVSTIYYWSHIGYIPKIKIGRFLRFRKSSILSWLKKKESKGRNKSMKKLDLN